MADGEAAHRRPDVIAPQRCDGPLRPFLVDDEPDDPTAAGVLV